MGSRVKEAKTEVIAQIRNQKFSFQAKRGKSMKIDDTIFPIPAILYEMKSNAIFDFFCSYFDHCTDVICLQF